MKIMMVFLLGFLAQAAHVQAEECANFSGSYSLYPSHTLASTDFVQTGCERLDEYSSLVTPHPISTIYFDGRPHPTFNDPTSSRDTSRCRLLSSGLLPVKNFAMCNREVENTDGSTFRETITIYLDSSGRLVKAHTGGAGFKVYHRK